MMKLSNSNTRRGFLQLAGTAAVIGAAGCSSSTSDSEQATTTEEDDSHHDDSEDGNSSHGHDDATPAEESNHTESGHTRDEKIGTPKDHAEVRLLATDDGYHFDPHVVWVNPGGTITWTLESGTHTATAYHSENGKPLRIPDNAQPWDSGLLSEQGTTFEHTFETEGVYDYYCTPHEGMGMLGSVIVGDPAPDSGTQPGLEPPQDGLPSKAQTKLETLNTKVKEALNHDG